MIALQVTTRPAKHGDELAWEPLDNPPFLLDRGNNVFLIPPRKARAYVNGIPVIAGIQVVQPGDLVCVMDDGGDTIVSYRVAAGCGVAEAGQGRPCAFTGRPISGMAFRCGACDRVVGADVAREIGTCPACGHPIGAANAEIDNPAEELL